VGTGCSSLLRLLSARRGRVALLAGLLMTVGALGAGAAGASPDPSPSVSAPAPDPYPTFSPPAPREPSTGASAPSVVQTRTSTKHVAPTSIARAPVHHSSTGRQRSRPALPHEKAAVKPLRLPTHPAPGLGARDAAAAAVVVEPHRQVSPTLALAVALLVLLSAGFLAGAAREVAR
jgi:hypothetical protein